MDSDTIDLNAKLYKALTNEEEDEVHRLCGDLPEGPMHVVTIHGDSVLHVALYSMQAELAELLLSMCQLVLDLDLSLLAGTNAAGNTLLHEAATHDKFLPFAKKLLDLQPQLLFVTNKKSETPLFSAARYGQMKMFKFLDDKLYKRFDDELYLFADIYKKFHRKDDGSTILHAAIEAEHFKLACWIAKKHEYLHDQKNKERLTALQLLACNPLAFRFRGEGWLKTFIDFRIKNNNEDEDSSHPHKVTYNYRVPWWDEMLGKRRRYDEAVTLAGILIQKDTSWAMTEENDETSADEESYETSADEESDETSAGEEDDESTVVDSKNGAKKKEDELKNIEDQLKKIDNQKRTHQDELKKSEDELKKIETELKETESQLKKTTDQVELKKREAKLKKREAKLKRKAELMKKRETELKEREAELKKTYQFEFMKGTLAQLKKTDQDELKKIEAEKKKDERQQIPLLLATQAGCLEIVYKILEVHPEAVEYIDKEGRSILHIAIKYRQMKIFKEVKKIMEVHMGRLIQRCDSKGNSILHMVGKKIRNEDVEQTEKYSPFFQLQEDLLLFERIKKVIKPHFYKHTNEDGETAEELLALNKEALRDKSQEWLKRTAENCSIIAVLIATVAFAAAYTVPGGPNPENGSPVLLKETFFVIFTIGDVLSLTFCLTSVVIFLSILTSSFQLQEFKLALPQKLMLGITCLFVSVTMMMLAFSATIILMIHNNEQYWSKIALYAVGILPVTVLGIVYMPLFFSLTKTFMHSLKKIMSFFPTSIDQKRKKNSLESIDQKRKKNSLTKTFKHSLKKIMSFFPESIDQSLGEKSNIGADDDIEEHRSIVTTTTAENSPPLV